jgi:hypothetical protein
MLGVVFLNGGYASENQEVNFEIIDSGYISGYCEEAYFVVRTESEWEMIWERHTILQEPPPSCPNVDFSKNVVICAFMGRCPTAGYSIYIEKIWTDEEQVHVEIFKRSPSGDLVVAEVITSPFVIASLEKIDLQFVFHVAEENGTTTDYVLPEFSTATYLLVAFASLSVALIALKHTRSSFT